MVYGQALIDQRYWYPKFVCYDSATDVVRRYIKMAGQPLKITHHAVMHVDIGLNWAEWIREFLINGLEGFEYVA